MTTGVAFRTDTEIHFACDKQAYCGNSTSINGINKFFVSPSGEQMALVSGAYALAGYMAQELLNSADLTMGSLFEKTDVFINDWIKNGNVLNDNCEIIIGGVTSTAGGDPGRALFVITYYEGKFGIIEIPPGVFVATGSGKPPAVAAWETLTCTNYSAPGGIAANVKLALGIASRIDPDTGPTHDYFLI